MILFGLYSGRGVNRAVNSDGSERDVSDLVRLLRIARIQPQGATYSVLTYLYPETTSGSDAAAGAVLAAFYCAGRYGPVYATRSKCWTRYTRPLI